MTGYSRDHQRRGLSVNGYFELGAAYGEDDLTWTNPTKPSYVRHIRPHSGITLDTVTSEKSLPIGTACSTEVTLSGMVELDLDTM